MGYKIDLETTKRATQGRWLELLPMIDSRLAPAIRANGSHVPCPLGTGNTDGFRIPLSADTDGHAFHNQLDSNALSDGFKLLMWLNDWSFYEALKAVSGAVSGCTSQNSSFQFQQPVKQPKQVSYSGRRKLFDRWVRESSTEPNLPAIRYFISRGLVDAPKLRSGALRYHDAIPFSHDGRLVADRVTGELITTPAILCGMRSSSGVAGFCVIRVTRDGVKAGDYMNDMVLKHHSVTGSSVQSKQLFSIIPSMSGSCFRLGEVEKIWGICEGVETMLAVAGVLKTESIGAATTASLLSSVNIPEGVETLNIYADKDRNGRGEEAANKLMKREQDKRNVKIIMPDAPIPDGSKGVDWLDCIGNLVLPE